jgi:hypothetical protein
VFVSKSYKTPAEKENLLMKKRITFLAFFPLLFFCVNVTGQVKTNKDKLLTLAVRGEIAPTRVATTYTTTWEGKSKLAVGVGGINYELKLGEKIFGWANADRATMAVATVGEQTSWTYYTSIGNKVRILDGDASGEEGLVIGKFDNFVLIHFDDEILKKLTIGTSLQAKASGVGLEIEGYEDVFAHGIAPEILEKLEIKDANGKLEVPVVKEIPPEIIGQGAGRGSLAGNWYIQTCFSPDIEKYGLDELRFGDLVIMKDVQTDYGMGYYIGGATIGVICSSPSDISGMGIGVTPILSTRFGKLTARIDPTANIAKYLGVKVQKDPPSRPTASAIKTNKDKVFTVAVQGTVNSSSSRGYSTTYDGTPRLSLGMGSINYTVSVGDSAYGWANADHVEPDVSVTNLDGPALGILGCIGNEATVISGGAKGAKGTYIGKHGASMFWFPKDVLEKLSVSDKVQVKARGSGLKIEGFEDVRVNKISPELLEKLGITIEGEQLVVPAVMTVPGHIMGSGLGMGRFILENVDYD